MKLFNALVAVFAAQAHGLSCPPLSFEGRSWNGFFMGNFDALSSDTQGKLAVGGNFDVKSYSVGDEDRSDYHEDIVFVGGTCTWETGMIVGNLRCGNVAISESMNNSIEASPSKIKPFGDVSFGNEYSFYESVQGELNAVQGKSIEGTLADGEGDTLTLAKRARVALFDASGNNEVVVFTMSCTQLNTYHSVNIKNLGADTYVVFKLTGNDDCKLSNVNFLGTNAYSKTLFLFPDATDVLISETSVPGSIIATGAHFTAQSGEVNGQVIGASWSGITQLNDYVWDFCGYYGQA